MLSAALANAFRSTHNILNSHSENASIQTTLQRFEEVWFPVCRQLDCDPSNYWDIHLSTHKQTMALMQIGKRATSHMMKEIIHRAKQLGLTQKKGHKRRAKNSVVVVLCWWLLWLLLEDATQLPATSAGEAFFGSALPCDGGTSCIGGKCGCLWSGWSKGDPQIPEEICTGAKTLGGDKNCSKMFQEFLRNF